MIEELEDLPEDEEVLLLSFTLVPKDDHHLKTLIINISTYSVECRKTKTVVITLVKLFRDFFAFLLLRFVTG